MAETSLDYDRIIQEFRNIMKTWEANRQKVNPEENSRLALGAHHAVSSGAHVVSSGAAKVSEKLKKILSHKGNIS